MAATLNAISGRCSAMRLPWESKGGSESHSPRGALEKAVCSVDAMWWCWKVPRVR